MSRCHKASLAPSLVVTAEAYFNRVLRKYDYVSKFLCPSKFLLGKYIAGGFSRERLVYLPNALDPKAYPAQPGVGDYVLFAGRLSQEKGVVTLLQAMRGSEIPLRVAGTGPLETECTKVAAKEGLSNVDFCGYCQNGKLARLYRNAAFVVVPSEWYENAPMSILEAFAYGKPVLGSRLGGIPELVRDGITGRLFEAGCVEDLRDKLVAVWRNKAEIREMGQAARRRIDDEFSMEKHIDRLLEIYESLVN
jgi:glycosyltransferase involved in cell wall biosynthesis